MYNQFKIHGISDHHPIPFIPTFKQKMWLDCVDNNYNIITRRVRQCGYTTVHTMSALKIALTNTNFNIGLCEIKNTTAIETLRRIVWIFENSTIDTNITIISKRQHEVIFSNGSTIRIVSHDGYRGQHFDMMYFDIRSLNDLMRVSEAITIFPRWTIGWHYNYLLKSADMPSLKQYRQFISHVVQGGAIMIDFDRVWGLKHSDVISRYSPEVIKQEFELPPLHA